MMDLLVLCPKREYFMSTIAPLTAFPANDRVVLHNVTWETYASLRRDLKHNPIRLTYDGSSLEIMSPSRWHEFASRFLGRMIAMLAFELQIPIATGGSTTFQRIDVKRGLEPDECFWIAHESAVRGKRDIDLAVDPPPDLAIEIDISPVRWTAHESTRLCRSPKFGALTAKTCTSSCGRPMAPISSVKAASAFHFCPSTS